MLLLSPRQLLHLVTLDGQVVQAWAPDNGPLIVGSDYLVTGGQGPYSLGAATITAMGAASVVPIAEGAGTFPFLGFTRGG